MPGRLLITGANGYLGARCLETCMASPRQEVVAVWHARDDRLPSRPPRHVIYAQCDLADVNAVRELMRRWDIESVIHSAALLTDDGPDYLRRAVASNILATASLAACAAEAGCRRFVYCSSISVYGAAPCPPTGWDEDQHALPQSVYAWSKYAGEESLRVHCTAHGMTGITLRLAGIHGGARRGGVVFQMIRAALDAAPLTVNMPALGFQLLFIEDAAQALLQATSVPLSGSYACVNVASHLFESMTGMAQHIVDSCGSPSRLELGSAAAAQEQFMNTRRMRSILQFTPGDAHAAVGQMIASVREEVVQHPIRTR